MLIYAYYNYFIINFGLKSKFKTIECVLFYYTMCSGIEKCHSGIEKNDLYLNYLL